MEYQRQSKEARQEGERAIQFSAGGMKIGSAVGKQPALNSLRDQITVITLLARIPPAEGGPTAPLYDPRTPGQADAALTDSILKFQRAMAAKGLMPAANCDGRVDAGGTTLALLNRFAGAKPSPNIEKADPGEWWIKAVDTFGLPIKAGVTAAKVGVSLLNDRGETYTINGYGGGVGLGAELALDKYGKVLGKMAEIGLKAGDIANIHKKLSMFSFYSKTAGAVFKRASLSSNYTIDEITEARTMVITNAAASTHYGIEIGLILFFPGSLDNPLHFAAALGRIGAGQPWGAYGNFSGGKFAAEVGITSYAITSVDKS